MISKESLLIQLLLIGLSMIESLGDFLLSPYVWRNSSIGILLYLLEVRSSLSNLVSLNSLD